MKHELITSWKGGMGFEAIVNGHKLTIDADASVGGNDSGPRPKPLMLLAVAGCTGMDVVSMLAKMRVELDDFDIKVETDMTEEHPKHFTHMHITYIFTGKDLPMDKLQKAVDLSQERYCGVSYMYKKAFEVTFSIEVK